MRQSGGDRNVPKQSTAVSNKMCVHSLHFSLVQFSHLETGTKPIPCLFREDEAFRIVKGSGKAARFLSSIECVIYCFYKHLLLVNL